MSSGAVQVKVHILDKEYNISCPPDEKAALVESAKLLDARMRETRAGGKVVGVERVAVMAALNLSYELLTRDAQEDERRAELNHRLHQMQERIDAALSSESES